MQSCSVMWLEIDTIRATVNEIRDNKIKFTVVFQQQSESSCSTRENGEEKMMLLHKRRRNVEEHDVVGFVGESKAVIHLLKEESSKSNVVTISIQRSMDRYVSSGNNDHSFVRSVEMAF
ncbi:hypothetical protein PIB30_042068 [Stylosanthes scabra]|uniref:Uncharacterized protein n=1 Tax=Stylosanthes scabra TaxID=79078 RepID=A0ABU6ZDW9_9FABA|nr:hypothetical protein [Stylosanthes scabra]